MTNNYTVFTATGICLSMTDTYCCGYSINPLNPELNPICYLLALLGAHNFLHVSRIRLRSWVRIPPGAWIFVCCECRVLSGRGLCDELITRPEESYQLCCVVGCDLETSRIGAPYIYDISSLRVNNHWNNYVWYFYQINLHGNMFRPW